MIEKISLTTNIGRKPIRSLLKSSSSKLKSLEGSSMSGYNPPRFYESEMVIPGGLDFKEKAYYVLKGKLPKSVYERWFPNDGEHVVNACDQLVTVERTYSGAVGNIIESPHGVDTAHLDVSDSGMINEISGGNSISDNIGDVSDDGGISTLEIFKHLVGLQ